VFQDREKASLDDTDWRSDLLHAVHTVFAQEQESLLAELRTQSIGRTLDAEHRQTIKNLSHRMKQLVRA
jgi:hypothetical protein